MNRVKKGNEYKILSRAIDQNNVEMLRKALNEGVDPNARKNPKGAPPLYYACRESYEEIAIELIKHGADFTYRDEYNYSIFLLACSSGMTETAKLLLSKDDTMIHQITDRNENGFMVASLWGHIDTMKLLMEKGIDIFNKTNDNEDALMYACSNDQVETFEFLINLGFDPNVKDANSYSSLNHAIFFHSNNVIKYFLEHTDLFNDENKKLLNSIRLDYLF